MSNCPGINWTVPVISNFESKEVIQQDIVTSSGCLIAAFCLAFLISGVSFLKWRFASASVREQVWQFFGWFTAFACCGSCVGCVAYAANMKYRYLLLQYTIERQNAGPNLFSEFGRISLIAQNALRWQMIYFALYPFELAFLTLAKLLALDRMIKFAKFKQNPALQRRISVASRVVVALVVCINIVSIAGGIVAAANLQSIVNLYGSVIADYSANPGFFTFLRIIRDELPKGNSLFQEFNQNSDVQLISEVALLALLIAVFVVSGIVCIRRGLSLVIAPAEHELEENRRMMLRQIGSTVLAIFLSFLLRIVFTSLLASANSWISRNLTPEQLVVFLSVDVTNPTQLVSTLQIVSPGSDLNCLFLASFLLKCPEFQVCVILFSSPLTLLVALWGMTTLRARSLLFPSFFRDRASSTTSPPRIHTPLTTQ